MPIGMFEHLRDMAASENTPSEDGSTFYEGSSVTTDKNQKRASWGWFKHGGMSRSVKTKLKEVNKFGNTLRPSKKHEECNIGKNLSRPEVSLSPRKSSGTNINKERSVSPRASNKLSTSSLKEAVALARNSVSNHGSPIFHHSTSIHMDVTPAVRRDHNDSKRIIDEEAEVEFDNAFELPDEHSKGSGNLVLDSVERLERKQTASSLNRANPESHISF